jgi:hypothetical protein
MLLVSNTGLAFSVHYCDNKIASISIKVPCHFQDFEADCCGEFENENSDCCSDKVLVIGKKANDILFKTTVEKLNYVVVNQNYTFQNFKNIVIQKPVKKSYFDCKINPPPLYKLYHQFVYYG